MGNKKTHEDTAGSITNLKFRAWDKLNAVYTYSKDFKNLSEFFSYCQKCVDGGNDIVIEPHIRVKNIYVGDLIKVEFPFTKTIAPVFYSESQARYTVLSKYQTIYTFDFHNCKVVGNIHQNPEVGVVITTARDIAIGGSFTVKRNGKTYTKKDNGVAYVKCEIDKDSRKKKIWYLVPNNEEVIVCG